MDGEGVYQVMHAKIDTGFDGDVALPNYDFDALFTTSRDTKWVALADGTVRPMPARISHVRLGETEHEATILNFGDAKQPLIGMQILMGYSINIIAKPFGEIRIEPIDETPY